MMGYVVALHVIICASIIYIGKVKGVKFGSMRLPVLILIPFWGPAMCIADFYIDKKNMNGKKDLDLEALKLENTKYSKIDYDKDELQMITVPLEEAILINDASTRRKLMLDILHDKPQEYVGLLKSTTKSDDTELTHYATTTMMEIQSEYEKRIIKLAKIAKENPDNLDCIYEYKEEIVNYIRSGLIAGNVLTIYRNQLDTVLTALYSKQPSDKEVLYMLIDNKIELKQYEEAKALLDTAYDVRTKEENYYRLLVKFYRNCGRGTKIKEVLKELKENQVYLSEDGKRWFSFWNQEEC